MSYRAKYNNNRSSSSRSTTYRLEGNTKANNISFKRVVLSSHRGEISSLNRVLLLYRVYFVVVYGLEVTSMYVRPRFCVCFDKRKPIHLFPYVVLCVAAHGDFATTAYLLCTRFTSCWYDSCIRTYSTYNRVNRSIIS